MNKRGSVLIWVIWSVTMLAIFSLAINRQVSAELVFGRWLMDHTLTRGFAKAGVERALYELQSDKLETFDALNENWAANHSAFKKVKLGDGEYSVVCDPDQGYDETKPGLRYGVCDEAAKLNLNTATEMMLKDFLKAFFGDSELDETKRTGIAQAIIDWRDEDDARMSQGAEDNEYKSQRHPYEPRNGKLESVEELLMVRGITPEIYNAIKSYVTVYTPDGRINFNTAPVQVLQALGLNADLAERIVDFRSGPDLTPGTLDDIVFQDLGNITASFSAASSFSSEEFAQVTNAISAGAVSVNSKTFRIYSIGRLIRGSRTSDELITCVIQRDGKILYWKEGRT